MGSHVPIHQLEAAVVKIHLLEGERDALLAERQQAIEALRRIRATPVSDARGMRMWDIANQALAELGEQPK